MTKHDEHLRYILCNYGFLLPLFGNRISNTEFVSIICDYHDTENEKIQYDVEFLKKCYGYSFHRGSSLITIYYPDKFIEDGITGAIAFMWRLVNNNDFTDEQKEQIKKMEKS